MSYLRFVVLPLVLVLAGCGGLSTAKTRTVTYEVTGQETAEVAFVDEHAKLIKGQVVALPWSRTMKIKAGAYVSVVADGAGDKALVCVLKVDGVQVATQRSGEVSVVKCDTTLS